ncbi:MAG: hypothetical protein WD136_01320 [Cyanobium sp.]
MRASTGPTKILLSTAAGCGLAIGIYPRFSYDARGGGGIGQLGAVNANGRQELDFPAASLVIPPLNWRTTRVLGLPLPPGLSIDIGANQLAGSFEPATGHLQLRFLARFCFRLGGLYRAPDLLVDTVLNSDSATGQRHQASGQPLDAGGQALLVGVATVPPSGDGWLDRFLGLPDEALAMLRCTFTPLP